MFHSVNVPRSHDLVVLLNLAMSSGLRGIPVHDVQPLNRYTIEARYPGDWDPIDRAEAERAVTVARRVRDVVRSFLPSHLLEVPKP